MSFDLEKIQKIWTFISGIIVSLNLAWIPDWLQGLAEPEGTQVLFAAIGGIVFLWQFIESRTGKKEMAAQIQASAPGQVPLQLKAEKSATQKALYAIIPVWPAGKAA